MPFDDAANPTTRAPVFPESRWFRRSGPQLGKVQVRDVGTSAVNLDCLELGLADGWVEVRFDIATGGTAARVGWLQQARAVAPATLVAPDLAARAGSNQQCGQLRVGQSERIYVTLDEPVLSFIADAAAGIVTVRRAEL